jgi:putative ABC transport system permease protein
MISNYLRIGWRNISRHKLYSGINIGGLALGLAVGILLLIWVQDELSYDKFHKNGANIYRISVSMKSGTDLTTWGGLSAPFGPKAVRDIAGVQAAVRVREGRGSKYTYDNKDFFDVSSAFVEPGFFKMFTFPMAKGDPSKPFLNNQSIVITRKAAKKYFGTEDVIGKTILVDKTNPYTVTGLLEDFPHNSEFQYEVLYNLDKLKEDYTGKDYWKSLEEDWGNYMYYTYLQLAPGTDPKKVGKQMQKLRTDIDIVDSQIFNLLPLYDMHLYNLDLSEGSIKIVRIFLIVAIVILLIACVNYVNLSTARAIQRAGEIGIRKMIGAARRQLFLQFLWESLLIFSIALVLAMTMIILFIPLYNNITSKDLSFSFGNLQMITAIGLSMLITLLIAGIYPAVLLSSFNPLKTLKGRATLGGRNISFRKALVVLQFVIATVMIISTLIVGQQLSYIRSKALGYDKENVFHFDPGNMESHFKNVEEELKTMPGVHSVAAANQNLLNIGNMTGDTQWDGKATDQTLIVKVIGSDATFMKMMNFKMAAGVAFTGAEKDSGNYIINETAARAMGMKDPIGKRFKLWENQGLIVGVVKDFHYASLHQKIEPIIFYYSGSQNVPTGYRIYVKTSGADAAKAIASAKTLYDRHNPGARPFSYTFVDESLDKMYRTDQRTGQLFNYFAGIAIFISCLGLFGLATFATAQRVKEIGIRKVLGASVSNIITLLSADFLKTVLVAIVLATPLAWYIMHKWLEDYAYNVGIDWKVFLIAGSIAILIAFFTVSFQAIKAAIMNPVKSLKTE